MKLKGYLANAHTAKDMEVIGSYLGWVELWVRSTSV